MTTDRALSRPLRLATELAGESEAGMRSRLDNAVVQVALAPEFTNTPDAAVLLCSLVDQVSRFCGTVTLSAPTDIVQMCLDRDRGLHDPTRVRIADTSANRSATIDVTVGTTSPVPHSIVTCSDGWLGKLTSIDGDRLPNAFRDPNPVGALTAAALTAGEVFLRIIGLGRPPQTLELSAWSGDSAAPGTLRGGPTFLTIPALDVLLVGCGNVMNGWAVAARALRMTGHAHAVDRQVLREENLGPYSLARRDLIGTPKTALLAGHLQPDVAVTPHDEELDLFAPRITRWNLPLPRLVINGLDDVEPRHVIQRLWPELLIDMAAGGTTSQVIVHRRDQPGLCLLGAFAAADEPTYAQRVEDLTGLRRGRFLTDFNTPITAADVAHAPPEHRPGLQAAADAGQLICGYINQASLTSASDDEGFAAAAPFVSALTGARAAAITVALLVGDAVPSGLHWQYSFLSNRARTTVMRCADTCACQGASRAS